MNVPLVDLKWQHEQVADGLLPRLQSAMAAGAFVLGTAVQDFEGQFAAYTGIAHCVGVANGTDALELALRSIGLSPGAEVIVPGNSFIASAAAVVHAGGVPVLVDVDDDTLLMDLVAAEAAITPRTEAIMPVHLFGRLVDMPAVRELADGHGLKVVEDAAQAHGAAGSAYRLGSHSDAVAVSFYPGKNLGAYGDAGAILTADAGVAEHARKLRDHGSLVKYSHEVLGRNSRLDSLQAIVLGAKLPRLDEWNEMRRNGAKHYCELLNDLEMVRLPPPADPEGACVWHLFAVRVPAAERDRVLKTLNDEGIGAGIHYPIPIGQQPAMAGHLGAGPDTPVVDKAAGQLLSLPLYPGLELEQIEHIAGLVVKLLR